MADEKPDRFVAIPLTERGELSLNPREHPDLKLSHILTYLAIRSFIGTNAANDNYSRWTMTIPQIAHRAGLHRATVIEARKWLVDQDYVYVASAGQRGLTHTVILRREWFRETCRQERSRSVAIERYEAWIEQLGEQVRRENAIGAQKRNGKRRSPRLSRDTGQKSPGDDGAARGRHKGVAGGLPVVNGRPPVTNPDLISSTRSETLASAPTVAEVLSPAVITLEKTQEKSTEAKDTIREGLVLLKEMVKTLEREKAMPR